MRNAKNSTAPVNVRGDESVEKLSGKKLVQARLPFKVIAGSGSSTVGGIGKGSDGAVQPAINLDGEKEMFQEGRKRKLSFESEEQSKIVLGNCFAIKENVTRSVKKPKVEGDMAKVILFNDSEEKDTEELIEDEMSGAESDLERRTPQKVARNQNDACTQDSGQSSSQGKSSSTKVQIKLPLGGRNSKKRRKIIGDFVEEVKSAYDMKKDSSDGTEASSEEMNPQKRPKVDTKQIESDATEKEVIVTIDLGSESDSENVDDYVDVVSEASSTRTNLEGISVKISNTEDPWTDTPQNVEMINYKLTEKKGVELDESSTCTILEEDNIETLNVESVTAYCTKTDPVSEETERDDKLGSDREYIKNIDLSGKAVEGRNYSSPSVSIKCTNDVRENITLDPISEIPAVEIKSMNEQKSISIEKCDQSIIPDSSESTEAASERDDVKVRENDVMVCGTPKDSRVQGSIAPTKHLTPKQLKLMDQRRQAREEKERRLQEEKLQKQREKEVKELVRKREREEREEQRRKEREEREDQKRKEREEKERKRLAELEAKYEEKRKRNEAREEEMRKREEERRRKEQEKEEADIKAKKAREAFQKFFKPKHALGVAEVMQDNIINKNVHGVLQEALAFRPFEVKGDMKLAPVCRKTLSIEMRQELDSRLGVFGARNNKYGGTEVGAPCTDMLPLSRLYLAELKSGKIIPSKWRRPTFDKKELDDDVLVVEDELDRAGQAIVEETHGTIERFRAKFYKFWENRRPPYFGTWRKKTGVITPRRPFAQDKKYFDYEIDSDLEWEEEEPGESLDGSDDDKEKESEDDDYEVDNEWFVPHGHLSEEELQNEDDNDANTREAQKAKLQILQQEFAQEMKKKTEKIKPRLIGCVWADENGNQPTLCPKIIWDTLCSRGILYVTPPPMENTETPERIEPNSPRTDSVEKSNDKLKPIIMNERMLKNLIRLVHGNRHSKNFIIKEFIAYLEVSEDAIKNGDVRGPLKSMVREKIDEYAKWTIIEARNSNEIQQKKNKKRLCWIVDNDVLQRMGLEGLSIHNNWQYTLQPKSLKSAKASKAMKLRTQEKDAIADTYDDNQGEIYVGSETKKSKHNLVITKFTKVLPDEEKTLQLQSSAEKSSDAHVKMTPNQADLKSQVVMPIRPAPVIKKRVPLLMSVARGQEISQPTKNALISEYLKHSSNEKVANPTITSEVNDVPNDKVIMLN